MLLCGYWTCRVAGKSHINDFTLSAEACLPIIDAILLEVKNRAYPQRCFLNIDLPTNVSNHKVTNSWFGFVTINRFCKYKDIILFLYR